jgi:hypothetical protein
MSPSEPAAWDALREELDRWAAARRLATLWWRDDDAVEETRALARLLRLAKQHEVPVTLAVVPALVREDLATYLALALRATPGLATVVQHGYAHRDCAPPGAKKTELDDARPSAELARELAEGRARLEALFRERFLAVMVPPWNRIGAAATAALPGLGFVALSTYGIAAAPLAAPGLVRANCHVDIMRWRPERGFLGVAPALALLTGHLAARRGGAAATGEATGLLTHHLVHDEAAWSFLTDLLRHLVEHPAVRFLDTAGIVASARRRTGDTGSLEIGP